MSGGRTVLVVAAAWLVLLVYPVIGTVQEPPAPSRWIPPMVGGLIFSVGYLSLVGRIAGGSRPRFFGTAVAALAALAVIGGLVYGAVWSGGFVFVAVVLGFGLSTRPALAAVLGCACGEAALGVLAGAPGAQLLATPLVTLLAGASCVGTARLLALARELAASRQRVSALAVAEERHRLARDLHDSVKQHVFVAAMEIGSARGSVGPTTPPEVGEHLGEAAAAVRLAQRDLTTLIERRRPDALGGRPLDAAIREHLAAWSRRTGVDVRLRVHGTSVGGGGAEALFLAAQETLANVARHSGATRVEVDLGTAVLSVTDDGGGIADGTGGQGLVGIRERMACLGGSMTVDGGPGRGTTITCRVPDD